MKKKNTLSVAVFLLCATIAVNAQNTAPFWSLAGNSNANAASKLGTTTATPLRLVTNNAVRLFISGAGNVGIGTTAPGYKLQVVGAANGIYGSGTTYGVVGSGGTYGVYGSGTSYGVYGYSGSSYGIFGSSGYAGVYGSGTSYGLIGSGATGVYGSGSSYALYGSGGTYGAYASGSTYGVYGYSSSNYGVYGNSGYLGVYGAGTSYGLYGYSYGGYGIRAYSNDSYAGSFSSVNSYGIRAGTTNGFYAGVFDGNVWTSGTYYTSDKNLKKNIQEFSNAMSIINQLKPKNYEYLTDGKYTSLRLPKGTHYGLIAQELEQVLPNLVKESKRELNITPQQAILPQKGGDTSNAAKSMVTNSEAAKTETINIKAVNYDELIPIIIKGMQEQDAVIKQQQQEIDQLKGAIAQGSATTSGISSDATAAVVTGAFLKQNAPNPFNQTTTIQFSLPASAKDAQLLVYDQNGRMVKSVSLANGQTQVSFNKGSLSSGNYIYTLLVDGKKVDSKNMILTK
ncbi:MAG: tail fiber domain-containing protein [Panacibacter sp.]